MPRGQSLGAVDAVSGVAESGEDVSLFVECPIEGAGEDGHVGVGGLEGVNSFGGREEAEEDEVADAFFAQAVNGGDSATSGGEHGVGENHLALLDFGWELAVVFLGLKGLWVANEAEVTNGGFGHDVHETVDKSVAGSQNRDETGSGARQPMSGHFFKGGGDGVFFDSEMLGCLIGEEPCGLAKDAAKGGEGSGDVPQDGKLVMNERVVNDGELSHRDMRRLGVFVLSFGFGEFFFHLGLLQGIGEFLDLPLQDSFHVVGGVVDPVVGDAGLGKIVSPYFL